MEEIYEFNGITKEDAIKNAEESLGLDKEAMEITVKEEKQKRKVFSILDKNRVVISVKIIEEKVKKNKFNNNELEKVKEKVTVFLNKLSELYKEDEIKYDIKIEGRKIYVDINTSNQGKWIGFRGSKLEALQTILNDISQNEEKTNIKVYVNIGNYKEQKRERLFKEAKFIANKVIKEQVEIALKPMNAYDRKLIHAYLKDEYVKTKSRGVEPNRYIVITPKENNL